MRIQRFGGSVYHDLSRFIRVDDLRLAAVATAQSTGRRPEAAVVRVLQGRDERSVRTLIPDPRVLERGFHDVTVVNMGDLPEPSVSLDDLSLLRLQWPVTVLQSMVWLQQDLDTMRPRNDSIIRPAPDLDECLQTLPFGGVHLHLAVQRH